MLFPVMYAKFGLTSKVTDSPTSGLIITDEVVTLLNVSPNPAGPVMPVAPVAPV